MAIFVPEWGRVPARDLALRRALAALDDSYCVRRPLVARGWSPELFVCDEATRRWLAIVRCDHAFDEVDGAQLFAAGRADAFTRLLAAFATIEGLDAPADAKLDKLVVMQRCTPGQARQLAVPSGAANLRIVSGDELPDLIRDFGAASLVMPMAVEEHHAVKARFFPESVIPATILARRDFHRRPAPTAERVFLDVDQEWAAKLDIDLVLGPDDDEASRIATAANVRLVNGVAGSGKTLIALQRARLLARLHPQRRVLLLIHNTPIVAMLNHKMERARSKLPPNLEITTFFRWAMRRRNAAYGRGPKVLSNHEALRAIDAVRERVAIQRERVTVQQADPRAVAPTIASRLTAEQLLAEIDFINDQPLESLEAYREASRTGQGFALRADQRDEVWAVHRALEATLAADRACLWSAIPRDLCRADAPRGGFDHVLIDEAQFFSPARFGVVQRALEPGGQLFLCADPSQGFLRRGLSWRSAGLDVAGRTKKLRRSYRTTRAILQAASDVLVRFAGCDPQEDLRPVFDGMPTGRPPRAIVAGTPQDALRRLAREVEAAARIVPLSSMLVLHGDGASDRMLEAVLTLAVGPDGLWWLNREATKRHPPEPRDRERLSIAHIDTATGLEATVVFLVGIDRLLASLDAPTDSHRTDLAARKLYMAMTRAAQRLVLITAEGVPGGVGEVFDGEGLEARQGCAWRGQRSSSLLPSRFRSCALVPC